MTEEGTPVQGELGILRVGDRLRMAREAAGLSIADIANRTRITQRHLDAIERSDFDSLPGRTYVTGFARAFARAVDLPDADIAREVRSELEGGAMRPRELYEAYEPADPARVPPRRLAWTLVAVVALLGIAYGVWRTLALDGETTPIADTVPAASGPEAVRGGTPPPAAVPTPAIDPNSEVVLSVPANSPENVWIGFDTPDGKTENFRTLDPGETLTVRRELIEQTTLRTANPHLLHIIVGGRDLGPLDPGTTLLKNVSLKPVDLLARSSRAVTASPTTPAR